MNNFVDFSETKNVKVKWYKVEGDNGSRLIKEAEQTLLDSGVEKYYGNSYTFSQVLALPISYLSLSCNKAFESTLLQIREDSEKETFDVAIINLHSILFHQQTYEFANPYLTPHLIESLKNYEMTVEWVVSLQDDIYDIYRRLLDEGQVLNPGTRQQDTRDKRERKPIKDIKDLRFISLV